MTTKPSGESLLHSNSNGSWLAGIFSARLEGIAQAERETLSAGSELGQGDGHAASADWKVFPVAIKGPVPPKSIPDVEE
jgi:hypothetical protein